jgi:threonine synthase
MKINFIVKCVSCGLEIDQRDPSLKCPKCKSQLVVNYDYEAIKEKAKEIFDGHVSTIWKYRPLLPLIDDRNIVSIGEGGTKILRASKLKSQLGRQVPRKTDSSRCQYLEDLSWVIRSRSRLLQEM